MSIRTRLQRLEEQAAERAARTQTRRCTLFEDIARYNELLRQHRAGEIAAEDLAPEDSEGRRCLEFFKALDKAGIVIADDPVQGGTNGEAKA